jgi:hypothetical protein
MTVPRLSRYLTFCIVLATASVAIAQPSQPKLEIVSRQGDLYWIVETAADGSRRGGWVNAQVSLDRIDRSTFNPIPALAATPANLLQAQQPDSASVNERIARIEQALAAGRSAAPAMSMPAAPLVQIAQPLPQTFTLGQPRLQMREGFWFNGGFGVGNAGCVGCAGSVLGASGGLSLGGTVTPRLLVGGGTTGWYKSVDGVAVSGGTLDARIRFYPVVTSGFFLTGGGGLGTISVWNGFDNESEAGVGALFGIGWDIRVGRNVSLTPYYNGFAVGVESGTFYVDQFGLGITIH